MMWTMQSASSSLRIGSVPDALRLWDFIRSLDPVGLVEIVNLPNM